MKTHHFTTLQQSFLETQEDWSTASCTNKI